MKYLNAAFAATALVVFASCKRPVLQVGLIMTLFITLIIQAIASVNNGSYIVEYSKDNLCPVYVAYKLTKSDILSNYSRSSFIKDPNIPESPSPLWYIGSGYDKGHLCPSEDKGAKTFYTSNICPQNPNMNKGVWKSLECDIRKRVLDNGDLIIICGTIFTDKSVYIKGHIRVPDYLFKVIVYNGKVIECYKIPNQIIRNGSYKDYFVTIESIEKDTGLNINDIKNKVLSQ